MPFLKTKLSYWYTCHTMRSCAKTGSADRHSGSALCPLQKKAILLGAQSITREFMATVPSRPLTSWAAWSLGVGTDAMVSDQTFGIKSRSFAVLRCWWPPVGEDFSFSAAPGKKSEMLSPGSWKFELFFFGWLRWKRVSGMSFDLRPTFVLLHVADRSWQS